MAAWRPRPGDSTRTGLTATPLDIEPAPTTPCRAIAERDGGLIDAVKSGETGDTLERGHQIGVDLWCWLATSLRPQDRHVVALLVGD